MNFQFVYTSPHLTVTASANVINSYNEYQKYVKIPIHALFKQKITNVFKKCKFDSDFNTENNGKFWIEVPNDESPQHYSSVLLPQLEALFAEWQSVVEANNPEEETDP